MATVNDGTLQMPILSVLDKITNTAAMVVAQSWKDAKGVSLDKWCTKLSYIRSGT